MFTRPFRTKNVFYFQKYFIKIAKQYINIVLVNTRNNYVKYSHCGPIRFS